MLLEVEGFEWKAPGRSLLFSSRLLAPPTTRSRKPGESSIQNYWPWVLSVLSSCTGIFSKPFVHAPVSLIWTVCYSPLMCLSALQLVSPLHVIPRLSWLPFTVQVVLELLTVAFEVSGLGYFANVISTLLGPVGVPACSPSSTRPLQNLALPLEKPSTSLPSFTTST